MNDNKIVYCDMQSPVGEMLAGATTQGVCCLEWHDRGGVPRILERLQTRYRCETTPGMNGHLELLKAELEQYFNGKIQVFTASLSTTGTPFEQLVWSQLLKIPYGETRSYGQLSRMVGRPGAARAVGRANGANWVSIVIPCHRVIEANGNLRGYGGGLWRKKFLLELEGAIFKLPTEVLADPAETFQATK